MATTVKTDDPRMGDVLIIDREPRDKEHSQFDKPYEVVLVGFPFDEGVRRNGGRLGASGGPAAVRKLMKRMGTVINPEYGIDLNTIGLYDIGDVVEQRDQITLESAHKLLRNQVKQLLANKGVIPFVVGGGNDQSYPNGAALFDAIQIEQNTQSVPLAVSVVNIDAHLDVRPLKEEKTHSGSPFRQLLEDGRLNGRNFAEFSIQGNQCSAEHVKYLEGKESKLLWLSTLRKDKRSVGEQFEELLSKLEGEIFVSFDIDSIIGSDCPGVSAVGTIGLTSQEALDICFISGKNPRVRLFDLSEYNPAVEEYRTGRLVANMFYFFSLGVASRLKKSDS